MSGRTVARAVAFVTAVIAVIAVIVGTSIIRPSNSPGQAAASTPPQILARHTGGLTYENGSGIVYLAPGATRPTVLASGTFAAFAWSPDGSELAYLPRALAYLPRTQAGACTITVLDVPAGSTRAVNGCPGSSNSFGQRITWSPDGTKIAFVIDGQIVVMNADGSGKSVIGPGTSPSWSPDGTQIAFEDAFIAVTQADGTGKRVVAQDGRLTAWSPDGTTIAFLKDVQGPPGFGGDPFILQVWLVHPDGTHLTRLGQQPHCCLGATPNLSWSPDGSQIVLTGVQFQVIDVHTRISHLYRQPGMNLWVGPSWRPVP